MNFSSAMALVSAGVRSAAREDVSAGSAKLAASSAINVNCFIVFMAVVFRDRAEAFFTRFSHPAFYLPVGLRSYEEACGRLAGGESGPRASRPKHLAPFARS